MPNRWPISSGNWSNAAIWSGSLIPTASDDVFANSFTINMDTSIIIRSLNNVASASAVVAGGTYNFNSGSISASITSATSSLASNNSITVTATSGDVIISAPSASFTGLVTQLINHSGNCNFIITGSRFNAGAAANGACIAKSSAGTITIVGNITGAGNFGDRGLSSTNGNTVVIGDISGSTGNTGAGIGQSAGSLTVIGNILGGGGNNNAIAFSGGTLIISGSITGNSSAGAVVITGTPIINISGSIIGGSSGPAISSAVAHTLTHSGSVIAAANPAVVSTSLTATNTFTGPFFNNGAVMAVQAARMFLATNPISWQISSNVAGVSQSLFTADLLQTYPSASDVRLGTSYASGSLVGTLAMPNPASVQFGVPVDNTTGSAVLTVDSLTQAVWGRPRTQLTVTGSIGERLQNVATPASVGTQIASYLL